MKLIASLFMFSEKNTSGHHFFRYIDHETGKVVEATVSGGESNVRGIMFEMNGGNWSPHNVLFSTATLPAREFKEQTKGMPHAGSHPKQLAAYIKDALANGKHSHVLGD